MKAHWRDGDLAVLFLKAGGCEWLASLLHRFISGIGPPHEIGSFLGTRPVLEAFKIFCSYRKSKHDFQPVA
jgi:hypothetical protein